MRKVIVIAIWMGSVLLGQTAKVTVDVDESFARHNITVTPHTAANFRSVVESFAGTAGAETLARVHPLLMAIRNDSGLAITAVVFQYPRVNASGEAIHADRAFQTDGALPFPARRNSSVFARWPAKPRVEWTVGERQSRSFKPSTNPRRLPRRAIGNRV